MNRIPPVLTLLALLVPCWATAAQAPPSVVIADGYIIVTTSTGVRLELKVATTQQEAEVGLSQTPILDPQHGMLFTFPGEQQRQFWMKGMSYPLDIVFLSHSGYVWSIHTAPVVPSGTQDSAIPLITGFGHFVVELPAGEAAADGLKVMTQVGGLPGVVCPFGPLLQMKGINGTVNTCAPTPAPNNDTIHDYAIANVVHYTKVCAEAATSSMGVCDIAMQNITNAARPIGAEDGWNLDDCASCSPWLRERFSITTEAIGNIYLKYGRNAPARAYFVAAQHSASGTRLAHLAKVLASLPAPAATPNPKPTYSVCATNGNPLMQFSGSNGSLNLPGCKPSTPAPSATPKPQI